MNIFYQPILLKTNVKRRSDGLDLPRITIKTSHFQLPVFIVSSHKDSSKLKQIIAEL